MSTPYISARSVVIALMLSADRSSVTSPDIEIDAIDPVIVGSADGIDEVGRSDGEIVGSNVGAEVMNISQEKRMML